MHSGKKSELPKTFYVTYYKSMLPPYNSYLCYKERVCAVGD